MKIIHLKKVEKVILLAAALLLVIIIAGVLWLVFHPREPQPPISSAAASVSSGLTEKKKDHIPTNIILGEKLPYTDFTDESGNTVSLNEYKGKTLIISFWTSWCPYCKSQTEALKGLEKTLVQYDNVDYLLIDKLDNKKDTKEKVKNHIAQNKIPWRVLYDNGLNGYKAWGVKVVPTTVIIDKDGIVKTCYGDDIKSIAQLQAMLDSALNGSASATEAFITQKLTGQDGGIHVNYESKTGQSPVGYDVLSETQGLMMEYAVVRDNKALFDKTYEFVKNVLTNDKGLSAWMYSVKDGAVASNALLDDLRIFRALNEADTKWGGYGDAVSTAKTAILTYNTDNGHMINLYDNASNLKAKRFNLCFADFKAISMLGNTALYDDTLLVVEKGYIGDGFPLYYNFYDYETKAYDTASLNTAEALYTLYHLACIDKLKPQSLAWLKQQMDNGGLKARYNIDGTVPLGYDYHSTAVYALVGLIGEVSGDKALFTKAVAYMEKYRINAAGDALNGAFGSTTGSDINAFDECLPLLLYGKMEEQNS